MTYVGISEVFEDVKSLPPSSNGPLRPELAAVLGGWPLSQLTERTDEAAEYETRDGSSTSQARGCP